MSHVFDKYQLGENTRFNTEIVEVRWNEKELLWDIHVKEYPAPTTEEEKYRDENLGQWSSSWTRTPIKEEVVKANLIFNVGLGVDDWM